MIFRRAAGGGLIVGGVITVGGVIKLIISRDGGVIKSIKVGFDTGIIYVSVAIVVIEFIDIEREPNDAHLLVPSTCLPEVVAGLVVVVARV